MRGDNAEPVGVPPSDYRRKWPLYIAIVVPIALAFVTISIVCLDLSLDIGVFQVSFVGGLVNLSLSVVAGAIGGLLSSPQRLPRALISSLIFGLAAIPAYLVTIGLGFLIIDGLRFWIPYLFS